MVNKTYNSYLFTMTPSNRDRTQSEISQICQRYADWLVKKQEKLNYLYIVEETGSEGINPHIHAWVETKIKMTRNNAKIQFLTGFFNKDLLPEKKYHHNTINCCKTAFRPSVLLNEYFIKEKDHKIHKNITIKKKR